MWGTFKRVKWGECLARTMVGERNYEASFVEGETGKSWERGVFAGFFCLRNVFIIHYQPGSCDGQLHLEVLTFGFSMEKLIPSFSNTLNRSPISLSTWIHVLEREAALPCDLEISSYRYEI
jgi:hypothetical protein